MDSAAWVALGIVVCAVLVIAAYFIGRGIWSVAEPGDEDPGGAFSPPRLTWYSGPTLVDVMRMKKRLEQRQARAGSKEDETDG